MTFWVQHGYGKGNKISDLVDTGLVTGGVLLSPGDEEAGALTATATALDDSGVRRLLDPQFYVYSIQGAAARCHNAHGLDFGEVTWFVTPRDIQNHVEAILRVNDELGFREPIAPAPYLASFNDVWAPVSLQYARAFVEGTDRDVFVSVVAEDSAFADWDATTRWLDALTTIDAHGIYVVVSHAARTYPFAWETDRLTNVLRVIYALSELNDYEVIWGYADIAGLLGLAVGAEGFATGWYHSLRMWTPQKWVPQRGGRQANPRVFCPTLLSPLEAVGEATSAARSSFAGEIFPDPQMLRRFRGDPNWGITAAWYQHMEALAAAATPFNGPDDVRETVAMAEDLLADALDLMARLDEEGVALAPSHQTRVDAMRRALELFTEAEGL